MIEALTYSACVYAYLLFGFLCRLGTGALARHRIHTFWWMAFWPILLVWWAYYTSSIVLEAIAERLVGFDRTSENQERSEQDVRE